MSALISNSSHSAAVRPARIAEISVIKASSLACRASRVEKRRSARSSPRCTVRQNVSPLVLEQTTQEHPPFPAAVETVQGMKAMKLFVGHSNRRSVYVVVILIGISPGIGVEHGDVDWLALTGEVPRPKPQDDARGHSRGGVLVWSPVGFHEPAGRLNGLLNIHDLFRRRGHAPAHPAAWRRP